MAHGSCLPSSFLLDSWRRLPLSSSNHGAILSRYDQEGFKDWSIIQDYPYFLARSRTVGVQPHKTTHRDGFFKLITDPSEY
jgi:hypothetical protein